MGSKLAMPPVPIGRGDQPGRKPTRPRAHRMRHCRREAISALAAVNAFARPSTAPRRSAACSSGEWRENAPTSASSRPRRRREGRHQALRWPWSSSRASSRELISRSAMAPGSMANRPSAMALTDFCHPCGIDRRRVVTASHLGGGAQLDVGRAARWALAGAFAGSGSLPESLLV